MNVVNEQYRYEIDTWLRTLDYLQQENISLKNRLAGIVKHNVTVDVLEKAEYFQSSFLNKDTVIAFLRKDIQKLKAYSGQERKELQQALRVDMQRMEKEFYNLKTDFNGYIQELVY